MQSMGRNRQQRERRCRHKKRNMAHDGHGPKPERGGTMGMRYLSMIPMAIFSLALQAQAGAVGAGQAPTTTAAQAQHQIPAAAVSAELTKRIDTKNAKQGDEVDARVTDTAKLPDG